MQKVSSVEPICVGGDTLLVGLGATETRESAQTYQRSICSSTITTIPWCLLDCPVVSQKKSRAIMPGLVFQNTHVSSHLSTRCQKGYTKIKIL